jgi:multidrug resistance protein, MATE family
MVLSRMILVKKIHNLFSEKKFRELLLGAWTMGWPLIIIMLLEFVVTLTDVYIAGKINITTQAAVGFVSQVYFVFIVIANAITIGTVSVVSRLHGGNHKKEFANAVFTIAVSVVVSGIVLTVVAFFIAPYLIGKSSIPVDVRDISVSFIKYYFIGLVFHYILINSNGVLRAVKRVKRSLLTMTAVALINVGLNFYFLKCTSFGYKGIALSTVAGYTAGGLINVPVIISYMRGYSYFSFSVIKKILLIGWPSLFQQISWQAGTVVLFIIVAMVPGNSVDVMAGFTTGLRIESAIFLPAYALNMTAAAVSGNLLGEKRTSDAYFSGIITALLSMGIIVILSLAVILNARSLAVLLSDSPSVIHECVRYLIIQMISEPFMAVLVVLSGTMSGAGDTFGVMRIVVSGMWFVRLPFAYLLGIKFGYGAVAIWWVMNADIFIRMVFTIFRYRSKKWIK